MLVDMDDSGSSLIETSSRLLRGDDDPLMVQRGATGPPGPITVDDAGSSPSEVQSDNDVGPSDFPPSLPPAPKNGQFVRFMPTRRDAAP